MFLTALGSLAARLLLTTANDGLPFALYWLSTSLFSFVLFGWLFGAVGHFAYFTCLRMCFGDIVRITCDCLLFKFVFATEKLENEI